MRAVWLAADSPPEVREVPPPLFVAGEARVRVRLAGVCSTDLELARGYMGFAGVPGHEFVGEVTDGPGDWRGARVVGEINAACGGCRACERGEGRHCPTRTVLGILGRSGAHAEELTLPVANLHRVPSGVTDEAAVFVEPLAAAYRVVEQVPMSGKRVAVLGGGKLGQLIARVCDLDGAEVTGLTRSARKRERLIAAGIAASSPHEAAASSFDVVVEATGSPAGLPRAVELVRPLGTIVLKTTSHLPTPLDLAPLVIDEVTIVGSRCGRFEPALAMLEEAVVDPTPLIDGRYSLADAAAAYERAGQPGVLKVLLTFD